MTSDARKKLRELAEKASPGPWYTTGAPWFRSEDGVLAGSPDGNIGFLIADCEDFASPRDEYEGPFKLASADADAAYIAAAHPGAIISLLDAVEKAEADLDAAKLAISQHVVEGFRENLERAREVQKSVADRQASIRSGARRSPGKFNL